MKQIIVNVSGLAIEEKQRVNEALAKIKGVRETLDINPKAGWLFAPASSGKMVVTWSFPSEPKTPTHTPQQVLEMAGMTPAADTLIITDSSGNIIFDSTPDSLNDFIKQRASAGPLPDNGVSVKLDKNGAVVMIEKRKVRKDFDPTKEYSVDVSKCTEEEKKEVQQAFFDAGFPWAVEGKTYQRLEVAEQYSNTTAEGHITKFCMYGFTAEECNMNPEEFLELVYEPEQHVHAEMIALCAEFAQTMEDPMLMFQFKDCGVWVDFDPNSNLAFYNHREYRLKPKTHIVHGVEIPDLRFDPKNGEGYYVPDPLITQLYLISDSTSQSHSHRKENNLCYEPTEEGKQAAILHAKAMLGVQS